MFAMLSNLANCLAISFAPPLAELTSPWPEPHIRPTSLQLMLIGLGTLAVYSAAKRIRLARHQWRALEERQRSTMSGSLPVAPAPLPSPHFAEAAAPTLSDPPEQHAA
jgi:hypothetical protein